MKNHQIIREKAEKIVELTCMRDIFNRTFENENKVYVQFTEDGEIKKVTFKEYAKLIYLIAESVVTKFGYSYIGRYIGLKADNSPYWLSIFWGVLMAGYKPVLIGFTEDDMKTAKILNECRAFGLITDGETGYFDAEQINTIKIQKIIDEAINIQRDKVPGCKSKAQWSDEFAVCTSGTTGMPRICVYNGRSVAAQIRISQLYNGRINTRMIYDDEIRILAFLPFHHIFGLLASIAYGYYGKTFVYLQNRAPSTILETCQLHKVTLIYSVPLFFNNVVKSVLRKAAKSRSTYKKFKSIVNISLLLQKILPETVAIPIVKTVFRKVRQALFGNSIDFMACGGGYVSSETLSILNAFGYYTACGFGMTEAGVTSFESGKSIGKRINGCLGRPHFGAQYRLTGDSELQIKGDILYSGEIINGEKKPVVLDDGWFSTGDIARLTRTGLWIVGRKKEVIINESGENVYPDELESMFSHLDIAKQLCVLGITNEKGYEDIALAVNLGELVNDKNVISQISNAVHSVNISLPVFKRVRRLFITGEEMPNANKIKVKRLELKKIIEEGRKQYIDTRIKK